MSANENNYNQKAKERIHDTNLIIENNWSISLIFLTTDSIFVYY